MSLSFDLSGREQLRFGKALGEIEKNGRHLRERAPIDEECRYLAFGIDRQVLRRTMLLLAEGERLALEGRADFVECDVRRHRAGTRCQVERECFHRRYSFTFP